ncbi:MAG: amidohydrolase family protein [Methylosarcina sp.]
MKKRNRLIELARLALVLIFGHAVALNAFAHGTGDGSGTTSTKTKKPPRCRIYTADRVFDGSELLSDAAVLVKKDKIVQVGAFDELKKQCSKKSHLGDATLMPGFIESHAHLTFQNVDSGIVLKHGITTVRDTGGPLLAPYGGEGQLRVLSAGPIIQAPGGYPLNVFGGGSGGYDQIGIPVGTVQEAEEVVQQLVDGGAAIIKISLEPGGGESGAPWMEPHGDQPVPATPWPLLPLETVQAIVAKAHALGKRVTAHIGENTGAQLALEGQVDEWAHAPCAAIDEDLLQRAVDQGVKVVTTIDTLGSCSGIHANVHQLANMMTLAGDTGSEFLYGSEIGHDNVPWGVNGQEMHLMLHLTSGEGIDANDVLNILKAATSRAGENLGVDKLGTLSPDAPADLIAVKGNPFERFKLLEYPDLVVSGGRIIVNNFKK